MVVVGGGPMANGPFVLIYGNDQQLVCSSVEDARQLNRITPLLWVTDQVAAMTTTTPIKLELVHNYIVY
ncbi:hypothetical protein OUZ56_008739 [Daphnia magna]|uniref:Uncharacterized protein n=1 Tax=Daphnia magna TaxID=35525 RepID=A0ABR0ADX2_9CRUS|nr:hypothetical protein OUZ56_008739 [Daphnia magna]